MLEFLVYSLIAGVAISVITAILGNFMVWKRLSYLGDAIGHSSLLGVAIGILFNNISIFWVFLVCIAFSLMLVGLKYLYNFTFESLIVFNVQLFLAIGLIILGLFYFNNGSYAMNYLLGDLMLLNLYDVIFMFILMAIVIIYVLKCWQSLLILTINEEIAYSENIKVILNEIIFVILIAGSIATLAKFVGVFLIPSLLIIPALIAKNITKSAIKSFVVSAICTYIAICLGILCSFVVDITVTPLITLVIIIEFIIIMLFKKVFGYN